MHANTDKVLRRQGRAWQTHGVGCANADDADDACPVVVEGKMNKVLRRQEGSGRRTELCQLMQMMLVMLARSCGNLPMPVERDQVLRRHPWQTHGVG